MNNSINMTSNVSIKINNNCFKISNTAYENLFQLLCKFITGDIRNVDSHELPMYAMLWKGSKESIDNTPLMNKYVDVNSYVRTNSVKNTFEAVFTLTLLPNMISSDASKASDICLILHNGYVEDNNENMRTLEQTKLFGVTISEDIIDQVANGGSQALIEWVVSFSNPNNEGETNQ